MGYRGLAVMGERPANAPRMRQRIFQYRQKPKPVSPGRCSLSALSYWPVGEKCYIYTTIQEYKRNHFLHF